MAEGRRGSQVRVTLEPSGGSGQLLVGISWKDSVPQSKGCGPWKGVQGAGQNAKGSKGLRQGELEVEWGRENGKYEKIDCQRREATVRKPIRSPRGQEGQATRSLASAGQSSMCQHALPCIIFILQLLFLFFQCSFNVLSFYLDEVGRNSTVSFTSCLHIINFPLWFQETLNETFPSLRPFWAAVASPTDNLS